MSTKKIGIIKYTEPRKRVAKDDIVVEGWINLYVNDVLIAETPITPKDMDDFVIGYLVSNGVIAGVDSIDEIIQSGSDVKVSVTGVIKKKFERLSGDCFTKEKVYGRKLKTVDSDAKFNMSSILSVVKDFNLMPSIYKETGGTHSAALANNKIEHFTEDISRRNAVYKLIGKVVNADISTSDKFMIVSGRISGDIAYTAIRFGLPMIVSISAPTDKAVVLGKMYDLTICGFARGRRANIYSYPDRIIFK